MLGLTKSAASATSPLKPMSIERRALWPHDVLLDVLYCGVCHSDSHQARNEWPNTVAPTYPVVPGHEIIGRVRAAGFRCLEQEESCPRRHPRENR